MLSVTLGSEAHGAGWEPGGDLVSPGDREGGFLAALFAGGDSRIAADPLTGLNKYLCPPVPAPQLTCVSSCTASPVSRQGFERATSAFLEVAHAQSARQRAHRLTALSESIKARLLQ
jgi:hypothetical protein